MKKIAIFSMLAAFALASCDLDFLPAESMTSEQVKKDPGGAAYQTEGIYAMFKEPQTFKGSTSTSNTYVRHYFQMAEFRSDNTVVSGRSSDPLFAAACYTDDASLLNLSYMWWIAYRIIFVSNSVIETVDDGLSPESDHIKGENYFFRALCHLHLVTLYAKPYTQGRENPGVVLRTTTDTEVTERATVGAVYDQIEKDLLKAIELMGKGQRRGDAGYVSKEAAQGLLSRVYLYMDKNQEVVNLVDEMLGGAAPESKLDPDIANYYRNALSSRETLWAVAHLAKDTRAQSSIASMYLSDGIGWGEIYYSDPLVLLFERYPHDLRYSSMHRYNTTGMEPDAKMIRWPVDDGINAFRSFRLEDVTFDSTAGKYYFTDDASGNKIDVETELVNTYPQNYIQLNGSKISVVLSVKSMNRNTFPRIYNKKFSYQDDDPMLSSPVMIRWGEVILNRAEAYAKLNREGEALADVNVLRKRAGLGDDELFTASNYRARGYESVLGVVLDERRMELCFEGHRAIDVYRNNLPLDRRYPGMHTWEVIQPADNRIPFRIPLDETLVSGLLQNP